MDRGLECPEKDCMGGDAARQLRVDVRGFKSVRRSDLTEDIEDDDELWECIYCGAVYTYVYNPSTNGRKPKIIWRPKKL